MSNFLEYSNMNHCNIIPQKEFEELTKEVFDIISSNLSKSLGPLGSSATILDGMLTEATKDGYAILNKYRFHNRYKKMIYNLIKAPCTKMNNTVGDGTTTAICLTDAIFKRYQQQKNLLSTLYRLPRHFIKTWDDVVADLTAAIQRQSTPIDPEDYDTIYNIAYVVSNGNDEISKNIAETYRDVKSPSIRQKDSPTNKSYISPICGFDFPANLITEAYVRNDDLSVEENNICTMIFDHKIENDTFTSLIMPINEVLRASGKKLLVLAPYYDDILRKTTASSYIMAEIRQYGSINLIMARFELSKLAHKQMSDLAIVLRSQVIDQEIAKGMIDAIAEESVDMIVGKINDDPEYLFYRMIGQAKHVLLTCKTGSIFEVEDIENDSVYQKTLKMAQQELEEIKAEIGYERQAYAAKIHDANTRVLQLEMKNYIYYIGADSQLQKQITWDSVEDVIKCVRSAIKSGIVPGSQLSIIRGCMDLMSEIVEPPITNTKQLDELSSHDRLRWEILGIIYAAICDVYSMVLNGPDGLGIIKLIPNWQYTTEEGIDKLHDDARKKIDEIIRTSIEKMEVFDVESLKYNKDIITSAETDTMVLSAASDLVKILISGNQCIFLDSDINESHQETMDVYT